jgi:hypothetical protein
MASQIERLARSRYWSELRSTIGSMYQRAFGNHPPNNPPKQQGW